MTNPATAAAPADSTTVINEATLNPVTGRPARIPHAVLLLVILCLPTLAAVVIAPVLPIISEVYAEEFGSAFLVPLVATVPSLLIALLSAPFGSIVDRIGRRRVLLGALLVYTVFGVAPLLVDSLVGIVLTRVGVGIAEAAITVAAATLLTDYFVGNRRNRYIGLSSVATSIAAALFLTIGGMLGASGWRTPFWLYLLALLLTVPAWLMLWEPKREATGRRAVKLPPIPFSFLAFPLVIGFFTGLALFSVVIEMPYVYTNAGVTDTGTIGLFSALGSVGSAIGAISFRWTARLGVVRLIPGLMAVAGLGLLLVWVVPSVWAAVAGGMITSFATGALLPAVITWTVTRLTLEQRGRGIGRNTSAVYLGSFAAPLVATGLAALVGTVAAALGVIGVVGVVGAVVTAILLAGKPQASLTHSVI